MTMTECFALVDGHAIERILFMAEGDVIVHHEDCPACLAGQEPTDLPDDVKRALIAGVWRS